MLLSLEILDFALIEGLELHLQPGLNVLSGETGAGKSILVDSLNLLLGERADSKAVRKGAKRALVQGVFTTQDGEETSLSRRLEAAGGSSARLDGERVSVSELAAASRTLLALHGQHASHTLLGGKAQRRILDSQLPQPGQMALARYREGYLRTQDLKAEISLLQEALRDRARQHDLLSYQINEIDAANFEPHEDEALRQEIDALRHQERIVQAAAQALALLSDAEVNALGLLSSAAAQLSSAERYHGGLAMLAGELRESLTAVQATAHEVAAVLASLDDEEQSLERLELRHHTLEQLKNKYGASLKDVRAFRERAADELAGLERSDETLQRLTAELSSLEAATATDAQALTSARKQAAAALGKRLTARLRPLGMAKAEVSVALEPLTERGPWGAEKVSFMLQANVGEKSAPLADVASGGELSRVMLALNVVTGATEPTLIFDEVDAGIGGTAARTVGELLKALAQDHQVLVVTHLAQVAAFADAHFLVEKHEEGGRTKTTIRALSAAARTAELARMLSGSATEVALAHAQELLDGVRQPS